MTVSPIRHIRFGLLPQGIVAADSLFPLFQPVFRAIRRWLSRILIAGLALSCTSSPPTAVLQKYVSLNVLGVSCTEVVLKITVKGEDRPTIEMRRDGASVAQLTLRATDTTWIDTSLAPGRTYTYEARKATGWGGAFASATSSVRTLDTTSHEFTWQVTTLPGTGRLLDVAIINDTLAYAVGEIHLTGEIDAYNLARWNGSQWLLLRIWFYTFAGQPQLTSYPATGILAFGASDIWILGGGDQIARWDGATQKATITGIPITAHRIWGTAANSIYVAGRSGGIAHYDGNTWTKIESGTSMLIEDIGGSPNPISQEPEILAVANEESGYGKKLLRIIGNRAESLSDSGLVYGLRGIFFVSPLSYYAVGNGVFHTDDPSSTMPWEQYDASVVGTAALVQTYCVRGNGLNDIAVAGSFGVVAHYNGRTWRDFYGRTPTSANYWAVAVRNNIIMAVGGDGQLAEVAIGRR